MRRAAAIAASAALVVVAQASGAPRAQEVAVQFSAYGPSQLDVLPGQIVSWSNISQRTHTVTSDTGIFDSGHLPPGRRFQVTFNRPGSYLYHCTIHPSITGEIDVRRVTLGPLPTAAVPLGDRVEFEGVAADPTKRIRIERRVKNSSFAPLATASARRDGAWRVEVPVRATGDYRARVGTDVSETRRLIVGIRTVHVRPLPRGVSVEVTPSDPYATILVEVYRRERFGWWPVARRRLDYVSAADVGVKGPARVRVVLVDRDGWTPIATSPPVTLARPPKRG
jgi:plastocyanin